MLTVGGDPQTSSSSGIGTPSDAEATGNGSVIAILKRHRTLLGTIIVLLGGGLPTLLLSGALSTNTVAAKATVAAPAYVEGSDVKLSTDLTGALRTAGSSSGGNPTAGRLDSIRYLQKLDTLNLLRAGRLDSLRRVQKIDSLSNIFAGRLDSLRRVQKVDTVTQLGTILAGRLDSLRRVAKVDSVTRVFGLQKVDSVSTAAIGVPITPSPLMVTISPAANTAGTITLPAVAGQFHYITALQFTRSATAVLAGTASLAITTTNLPAGTQWRVGNVMAAGGTQIDASQQFTSPIKSSVANTNTTIVFPAPGAAVLWNCTAWYYTAP